MTPARDDYVYVRGIAKKQERLRKRRKSKEAKLKLRQSVPRVDDSTLLLSVLSQAFDQGFGIRKYSVPFYRDGFSQIIYPGTDRTGRTDLNRTYRNLVITIVRALTLEL